MPGNAMERGTRKWEDRKTKNDEARELSMLYYRSYEIGREKKLSDMQQSSPFDRITKSHIYKIKYILFCSLLVASAIISLVDWKFYMTIKWITSRWNMRSSLNCALITFFKWYTTHFRKGPLKRPKNDMKSLFHTLNKIISNLFYHNGAKGNSADVWNPSWTKRSSTMNKRFEALVFPQKCLSDIVKSRTYDLWIVSRSHCTRNNSSES